MKLTSVATTTVALLVASLVAYPEVVQACTCAQPAQFVAPGDGTSVPPDTRIWADGVFGDVVLTSTSGDVVAMSDEQILRTQQARSDIHSFKPDADLVVGRSYEIHRGDSIVSTFRVAPAEDFARQPPVPVATFSDAQVHTGECSPSAGFDVRVTRSQTGIIYVADTNDAASYSGGAPGGEVSKLLVGSRTFIGASSCATGKRQQPNEVVAVRFGSLNASGRFSGWSEPRTVTIPDPVAGCACADLSQSSAVLALLLPLIFLRARLRNLSCGGGDLRSQR